ncbi:glycoside hydrolase family 43 protein [Bombardia bombarda]|uniref:Glycoside hydrolase family 43 protein n=1 Tax=Bombardia bombarda TaxID=252184 RepID=A0AA39TI76_9PEZI|nr:glycoside hydrolase family 43 protein [Bombardia bombarda]
MLRDRWIIKHHHHHHHNGPLITHLYTADPSAHVFNNRVYIYPSHDRETDIQFNDNGDQYDMADYHDIPWVSKQLWAPDAAFRDGKYYLYFPARDHAGIFRIGVAVGDRPEGPFAPDAGPIRGSYSIDPATFVDADADADGEAYMYFGGLWGGQLQCYQKGHDVFDAEWAGAREPRGPGAYALGPRVARMSADMRQFAGEGVREVEILAPETGERLLADDHDRRFFEAAWVHKRDGLYYLSYSTGDTHYLCYATGTSPYGPFTYRGRILEPVLGWTTHHSIVEFQGRWWLFHHDCELSGGVNHLRSVKVKEIFYDGEGGLSLRSRSRVTGCFVG